MSRGRTRVLGSQEYVSGTRANWLLAAGQARMTPAGELEILTAGRVNGRGEAQNWREAGDRPVWSAHSPARLGGTLRGFAMNGGWINRG